eukprot:TRINITY_DN4743_c0_g1_i1.p1 TRINITY_DN4743_c0_g1~~TRINITY_DN4743_c0_g1_i1.p1  ORF type:complete len:211 (-),score=42.42 TRINITY_DN4743_c0_g1_i1:226-816(-)
MNVTSHTLSVDGIELHFATNHIGHFLFTNLILPKLKVAALKNPKGSTRIINLTSRGHSTSPFRFSDWNFEGKPLAEEERANWQLLTRIFGAKETDGYNPWVAYGQSKTANVLFSEYLYRNLEKYGIVSLAVHPGLIKTEIGRHMNEDAHEHLKAIMKSIPHKTLEQGSSTTLVAAFDPKLDGKSGVYIEDFQKGKP